MNNPVVVATHIWPAGDTTPQAVATLTLTWAGVEGDRHFGETMTSDTRTAKAYPRGTQIRNHRQVSIVDLGDLNAIAAAMGLGELAPGVIADNICTSGIENLTRLPALSRLAFPSGAVIITGGENLPCVIAGRLVEERYGTKPESFPKAAMGLRGITGWVDRPGTISPGDAITIYPPL